MQTPFLIQDLLLFAILSIAFVAGIHRCRTIMFEFSHYKHLLLQNFNYLFFCLIAMATLIDSDGTRGLLPWEVLYVLRCMLHVIAMFTVLVYSYCLFRAYDMAMQNLYQRQPKFMTFRNLNVAIVCVIILCIIDNLLVVNDVASRALVLVRAVGYANYFNMLCIVVTTVLLLKLIQNSKNTVTTIADRMFDLECDLMWKSSVICIYLIITGAIHMFCHDIGPVNSGACQLLGMQLSLTQSSPDDYYSYPGWVFFIVLYVITANIMLKVKMEPLPKAPVQKVETAEQPAVHPNATMIHTAPTTKNMIVTIPEEAVDTNIAVKEESKSSQTLAFETRISMSGVKKNKDGTPSNNSNRPSKSHNSNRPSRSVTPKDVHRFVFADGFEVARTNNNNDQQVISEGY